MKRDRRLVIELLRRCVTLRCPVCGRESIVRGPFQIRHHCPACDALFKREDGFFVGAIMANVVATELAVLVAYLMLLPVMSSHSQVVLTLLLAVALLFPVAFYHHSWSAWLSLDHFIETLPKVDKRKLSTDGRRAGKNGAAGG